MRLTSIKALQRQIHDWQAKEQVSLTGVVHLEFIQSELKYLYTKRHACLLRSCDTLEHACMCYMWIIQWSNYAHDANLCHEFESWHDRCNVCDIIPPHLAPTFGWRRLVWITKMEITNCLGCIHQMVMRFPSTFRYQVSFPAYLIIYFST